MNEALYVVLLLDADDLDDDCFEEPSVVGVYFSLDDAKEEMKNFMLAEIDAEQFKFENIPTEFAELEELWTKITDREPFRVFKVSANKPIKINQAHFCNNFINITKNVPNIMPIYFYDENFDEEE